MTDNDPLDAPVTDEGLAALERAGVLSAPARDALVLWQLSPRKLAGDADRLLLGLGAALLITGAVVFFSLNWDRLGALLQLLLPQVLIAGCLAGVWRKGLQSVVGQVCLLAASVLVGSWLAIFGVVFHSGRDVFFLLASWLALITPWVLASRFAPLWLLWLALLNASIGRLCELDGFSRHFSNWCDQGVAAGLALGVLNAGALFARERAVERGTDWLAGGYSRIIVLLGVLAAFSIATLISIEHLSGFLVFAALQTVVVVALLKVYGRARPDFAAAALTGLNACLLFVVAAIRLLFALFQHLDWDHGDMEGVIFFGISGVLTLSAFALTATWLKHLHSRMRRKPEETDDVASDDLSADA